MKKILVVLILAFVGAIWWTSSKPSKTTLVSNTCSANPAVLNTKVSRKAGAQITGNPQLAQLTTREIADRYFENHRGAWGVQDYHLKNATEFKSPLGDAFVYEFSQGDIPVVGMEIRLRVGMNGEVIEEENTYKAIPVVEDIDSSSTDPATVLQNRNPRYGVQEQSGKNQVIFVRENLPQGELAISVKALDHANNNRPTQLLVRASDGKILQRTVARSEF